MSPSTERYDKGEKRETYATFAVPYLWHLDPRVKSLETFERREAAWLHTHTYFDTNEVRAAPFTELGFSLGLL